MAASLFAPRYTEATLLRTLQLKRPCCAAICKAMQLEDADGDWTLAQQQAIIPMDDNWEPQPPGAGARNSESADYCLLRFQLFPDDRYIYTRADWLSWLDRHWPHLRDEQ